MADITVRRIRFSFEEPIDFDAMSDEMLGGALPILGLSLTMPYLEPYLIRTMKVAIRQIGDETLAEDARRFSQQEGHHYRNHAVFNETIRGSFDSATAEALRAIEAALDADYQRFSREKSLRFNTAYAEGFEAMTCALALTMAEHGAFDDGAAPGGEIWPWHMAEEIEHRTVAFQVYDHLFGSYLYRIVAGTWAQWHYASTIRRFARCMARALGRKPARERTPATRTLLRRYLRTWSPRYDPSRIEVPDGVEALLAHYSSMARQSGG
ncbi:MAG: metal-dependent hydrolase [Myxococcota bacterium]|nr:metal-dependent hydrolase [Myxococcota bacterium]